MSMDELLHKIAQLEGQPGGVPVVPPPELIGFFVRWVRGLREWKQSTLADFAQVSLSTVERVERGEKVGDDSLRRIAQALSYEPGYLTEPRLRRSPEEVYDYFSEFWGNMEPVVVAPMKTYRKIREAAECHAFLIHHPDLPECHDKDIANLGEWLDLASFILSNMHCKLPASEVRRRKLYDDILACVQELEGSGATVLSGVMHAPQEGIPDWKVATISVTSKRTDPGASKRRHVFVDRRNVALPLRAK